jgi:conserved oligomeric Golgi complex subunit 3
MQLVGRGLLPRVVENMMDAKVELDGRLRTVINEFTNDFAARMMASLPIPIRARRNVDAGKLMSSTCDNIEKEVLVLRKALDNYLTDTRTKETLVGAVQDRVVQLYEDFFESYNATTLFGMSIRLLNGVMISLRLGSRLYVPQTTRMAKT